MSIDVDDLTPCRPGELVQVVPAPFISADPDENMTDAHAVIDGSKRVVCQTPTREMADLVAASVNDRYAAWAKTR